MHTTRLRVGPVLSGLALLMLAMAPPGAVAQQHELTFCEARSVDAIGKANEMLQSANYAEFEKTRLVAEACNQLRLSLSTMRGSYACKPHETQQVERALDGARQLLRKANEASNQAYKCE